MIEKNRHVIIALLIMCRWTADRLNSVLHRSKVCTLLESSATNSGNLTRSGTLTYDQPVSNTIRLTRAKRSSTVARSPTI